MQKLQALRVRNLRVEGSQAPVAKIDLFNDRVNALVPVLRDVLTRTQGEGDLVFPENRVSAQAVAALEARGVRLETLLGRRPTDAERNRFLDGREETIERRNGVIETLEDIGQLRTGLAEINGYLARTLSGRQLAELTGEEVVDYACMIYATIRTVVEMPEGADANGIRNIYDGFLDDVAGASVTSANVQRRVHQRVESLRTT